MLQVLRAFALLLTLAVLAGAAAVDFSQRSDAAAVSGYARLSPSMLSRLGAVQQIGTVYVRLGSTHARLITAELEDGPEGEEAPVTTFVKFVGDDQFRSSGIFEQVLFRSTEALRPDDFLRRPLYPVHSGFPTGPPAV